MVTARGVLGVVLAVVAVPLVLAGTAAAKPARAPGRAPRPAFAPVSPGGQPGRAGVTPLEGAVEIVKRTAPDGFIDDVVAADAQRLAYVVAQTATKAELHVYTHATKVDQVVDLAPITLQPIALTLLGSRVFVVGKTEDGTQTAGLLELADHGPSRPSGPVVYALGAASYAQTRLTGRSGQRYSRQR